MLTIDSYEVERLRKLIAYKRRELDKPKVPDFAKRILQEESMFLQKNILPIVQSETMILHYECGKSFIQAVDWAMKLKTNGLLYYLPIHNDYANEPTVAVFNPMQHKPFGTDGAVMVGIDNMSIDGTDYKPINLTINALMS